MHHGGFPRQCLCATIGGILLALIAISVAVAGEWESIRESYDNALRANEKRIKEIEAKESGIPDPKQRAAKITTDKVGFARASLKGGGKGLSLVQAAEIAPGGASAPGDLCGEQSEYLNAVTSEWGAESAQRKKLLEAT